MNNLSDAKRPKVVTEKFEMLSDLCTHFYKFSGSKRKGNLIRYLKSFVNRDSVPENYYEDPEDDKEDDQVSFTEVTFF